MYKINGKTVDYLFTLASTTCVRLSPVTMSPTSQNNPRSVQSLVTLKVIPRLSEYLSPGKITPSPLSEYIFYPVSTAPTNTTTQEKIKER